MKERTRSMNTMTYPKWLLAYYREAEMRSADLLQRLLRQVADPELQIALTRQLADEARHIQLWTELMNELGLPPTVPKRGYRHYLHKYTGTPASVVDSLALVYVIEERVQQRYRAHIPQAARAPRIMATLQALAVDEEWHMQSVHRWLATLEKREGRTRVAAALDYYRPLEARAYAALIEAAH